MAEGAEKFTGKVGKWYLETGIVGGAEWMGGGGTTRTDKEEARFPVSCTAAQQPI